MVLPDNNRIVCNPLGKSSVWKHFGFSTSEDGTPVKDKAVCRLYLSSVSCCKNTANFRVHLERHHRSEYTLLLHTEGDKDKVSEQSQPALQKVLERSNPLPNIVNDGKHWSKLSIILLHLICSHYQWWRTLDLKNCCTQPSLVLRFHLDLTLLILYFQ